MLPRVLLAATFDVSTRLASLLARREPLQLDTANDVVIAMRRAGAVTYDVVVIDLSLRGAFLLIDMLRTIQAQRRPLVIALRGTAQERAVLDSDVITAVLAVGEIDISGDVVIQLARVAMLRRAGGDSPSGVDGGLSVDRKE